MGEAKSDDVKGRVKEAAGVLTGEKDLENDGKPIRPAPRSKRAPRR